MYPAYLLMVDNDGTEFSIKQYLQEYGEGICPGKGAISYVEGKFECSVHHREDSNQRVDGDDGIVSYL